MTHPPERDAEAKALPRLRSRRLIVIEPDATRARTLAEALGACDASVAVVSSDADFAAAHALDADALLVDARELAQTFKPMVDALRRHPRVRWATLVPIAGTQLWPDGAQAPSLAAIASQVATAAAPAVELAVRAKGRLPHETTLEPLGLNRMVRVLADTQRALHIELSGAWGSATLELGEGRILAAQARNAARGPTLTNLDALTVLLALPSAQVRITTGTATAAHGWNRPVSVALTRAAALLESEISALTAAEHSGEHSRDPSVPPSRPQIAPSEDSASIELDVFMDETLVAPVADLMAGIDPYQSGSRLKSDLADTREVPVTQVLAEIDANAAVRSERPDAPAASATLGLASRLRWRGVLLAAGGAVVLAGALLIARSGPDSGDRARTAGASVKPEKVASRAARAPSKSAQGAPAQTANAPGASVDSTEAAGRDLAQAPARPRLLDEARELVKRARRFRRAGQLDQAEAAYLKALTNLSDYPLAISGLARIYLDRKNAAEAVRWAKQLVQVQPDRSSNHQLLGDAYALAGNHAEAEQAWKRATELASKTARKRP